MTAERWEDERWLEHPLPLDCDFDADDGAEVYQLPPGVHVVVVGKVVDGERVLVGRLAVDLPDIAEYRND